MSEQVIPVDNTTDARVSRPTGIAGEDEVELSLKRQKLSSTYSSAEAKEALELYGIDFNSTDFQWMYDYSFVGQPFHCDSCGQDLSRHLARIRCAMCKDFDLCITCFAKGVEVNDHKKNHPYIPIGKLDFPLYNMEWSAEEEYLLLEGVSRFGFGNWNEVADLVSQARRPGTKVKRREQCKRHFYDTYFADESGIPDQSRIILPNLPLPSPRESAASGLKSRAEDASSRFSTDSQFPRRDTQASAVNIIGYMPLRGDFDVEYDNEAELLLADMEFRENEAPQEKELKFQVLQIYNSRLDERILRKRTIIERNLLDNKRQLAAEKGRPREIRELHTLLRSVSRFHLEESHDELVQMMVDERRLRYRLWKLQEWRSLGLQSLSDVERYEEQKRGWEGQPGFPSFEDLEPLAPPKDIQLLINEEVALEKASMSKVNNAADTSKTKVKSAKDKEMSSTSTVSQGAPDVSALPTPPAQPPVTQPCISGFAPPTTAEAEAQLGSVTGESLLRSHLGGKSATARQPKSADFSDDSGADLLTEKELDFCRELEIKPSFYILIRAILLRECTRKIPSNVDVFNFTRELVLNGERTGSIYDFTVQTLVKQSAVQDRSSQEIESLAPTHAKQPVMAGTSPNQTFDMPPSMAPMATMAYSMGGLGCPQPPPIAGFGADSTAPWLAPPGTASGSQPQRTTSSSSGKGSKNRIPTYDPITGRRRGPGRPPKNPMLKKMQELQELQRTQMEQQENYMFQQSQMMLQMQQTNPNSTGMVNADSHMLQQQQMLAQQMSAMNPMAFAAMRPPMSIPTPFSNPWGWGMPGRPGMPGMMPGVPTGISGNNGGETSGRAEEEGGMSQDTAMPDII